MPEDNAGLVFVDPAFLDQIIKELSTGAELGDEPDVTFCRNNLI